MIGVRTGFGRERQEFHRFVVAVILLAGVVAGMETSPAIMARHGATLLALDKFILGVFVALFKMTKKWEGYGQKNDWDLPKRWVPAPKDLDLGTPLVDLCMWVTSLDPTAAVSCAVFGRKDKDSVEDSGCAMVRFANGACLMLEVNWNLRDERDAVYLQIYGSKGAGILTPLQLHKSIRGVLVNVTPKLAMSKNYYKESYQAEIDHYWTALSAGGAIEPCGWLRDRYGVSWQIVPARLGEMMKDTDRARARRVMEAMLAMKKLDIAALERAAEGK